MHQQLQRKIIGNIWGNLYLIAIGTSVENIQHLNIEVQSMEHTYPVFTLPLILKNKLENSNGNILIGKMMDHHQVQAMNNEAK